MSTLRISVLTFADAGSLAGLWPHTSVATRVPHLHAWVAHVGPDRAAVELCLAGLWLVAAWLGIGIGASVAAALPGAAGRSGARIAHVVLPRALYRLVAGAVGLGVLVTPGFATAAPATSPAAVATPTPDWPSDAPVPTPYWPTDAVSHRSAHPPATPLHRPRPRPHHHRHATRTVVVQTGDSLWTIAAEHLPGRPTPRRIAAAWPRWYAANRAVIGDDPNLIFPGQHLHTPSQGRAPSEG